MEGWKNSLRQFSDLGQEFWQDESGVGVVEIILILVVLIALVLIFKSQLTDLVNRIFEKISSESSKI